MSVNSEQRKLPSHFFPHLRDKKGNVLKNAPYRMHCVGRAEYYEIPKGSGNWCTYRGDKLPEAKVEELVKLFPKIETPKTLDQQMAERRAELEKLNTEIAAKKLGAKLENAKEAAIQKKDEAPAVKEDEVAASIVDEVVDSEVESSAPQNAEEAKSLLKSMQQKTAGSEFASQLKDSKI